jgi:hypothetical protein
MHALQANTRRDKNLLESLKKKFSKPAEGLEDKAPSPHHTNCHALQDDFLGWLRFVNAGMLNDGNIIAMDLAIKQLPDGAIVEVGSFCGLSTNVITHLCRKHRQSNPFFTCDPWIFEGADKANVPLGDGGITFGEYRNLVRDSFLRNVKAFSRNNMPFSCELPSDEFFNLWNGQSKITDVFGRTVTSGGPVAFAYVDGDHRYAQARADFENIDKHLVPDGCILFDDSADGSGWEVCDLVDEIRRSRKDYWLVDRFPNYMFQKLR